MDDRMRAIIGKVRATAAVAGQAVGRAAEKTGKVAGEMVETSKMHLRVIDLENDINDYYKELGRLVYVAHINPEADTAGIDDILNAVDEKNKEINTILETLEERKASRKCTNADCGHVCAREDRFCPKCGAPLDGE
ncbi:hypothetical protein LJC32_05355 [Oscillospiraceae bacterium OttesenSCG-928-F05]|nr:hypothetical protein [Oscillospiraceae bacterium OttesenSCG-928-F05]